MKSNTVYHVTKVMLDTTKRKRKKDKTLILEEQYITVVCKSEQQRLKLRRITYLSEDGKQYVFLTNNFQLSSQQIATNYKTRWMNELLFKQIQQNFPLRYFWGESENAIKAQIYAILIAELLMVALRKKSKTKTFGYTR
jgi:IS4 transposase